MFFLEFLLSESIKENENFFVHKGYIFLDWNTKKFVSQYLADKLENQWEILTDGPLISLGKDIWLTRPLQISITPCLQIFIINSIHCFKDYESGELETNFSYDVNRASIFAFFVDNISLCSIRNAMRPFVDDS